MVKFQQRIIIDIIKMMLSFTKQANRSEYIKKKLHQVKEKAKRHSQEKDYFDSIKTMTSEQLFDFVNDRYDNIASRNQSMQLQMNKSILERTKQLKIELLAKHKKMLFDFVIGGGGEITDQIYNGLLNYAYPQAWPNNWKCTFVHKNNMVFAKIIFHYRPDNGKKSQMFHCCPLPEKFNDEINPKRFKKESIIFMEEFLQYEQKIAEII